MEILENLINLKLHIGYAYHKKALLLVEEHKYKEALIACSKAIKYDPKMLDAYQAQVSVYEALTGNEILLYQAYVSLGKVLLENKEYKDAINVLNKAINPSLTLLKHMNLR